MRMARDLLAAEMAGFDRSYVLAPVGIGVITDSIST